MVYAIAWDENVPSGSSDARFLDDRMRDRQTAIRERLCDIFGGLTLLEWQADPILVKGLCGGGDADFELKGGTATTSFKGADGLNNDLQVDHTTGDATGRRDLIATRYIVALGGFRSTLDGWVQANAVAGQAAVEIVRASGRALMLRAGSVLGVAVAADAAQIRTAGTLTVEVWKSVINPVDGTRVETATGLTASLSVATPAVAVTSQAIGLDTFDPGDELFIKWTTDAGWLPITLDFRVSVEIET
jgi:hypothetical protein